MRCFAFNLNEKMAHLILVSNMIDRDAAFSLKRIDGSGPFSGLTQLHANHFFLSNLFCGFLLPPKLQRRGLVF